LNFELFSIKQIKALNTGRSVPRNSDYYKCLQNIKPSAKEACS